MNTANTVEIDLRFVHDCQKGHVHARFHNRFDAAPELPSTFYLVVCDKIATSVRLSLLGPAL